MSGALHVLCIDDEEDILEAIRLCLDFDGGFCVSTANSAMKALNFLDQVRPDLILLDGMMPLMDGSATFQAILSLPHARNIPVIFMTARSDGAEADQYLAMGAIGVVPKPFDPVTLASEIRQALAAAPKSARARN